MLFIHSHFYIVLLVNIYFVEVQNTASITVLRGIFFGGKKKITSTNPVHIFTSNVCIQGDYLERYDRTSTQSWDLPATQCLGFLAWYPGMGEVQVGSRSHGWLVDQVACEYICYHELSQEGRTEGGKVIENKEKVYMMFL